MDWTSDYNVRKYTFIFTLEPDKRIPTLFGDCTYLSFANILVYGSGHTALIYPTPSATTFVIHNGVDCRGPFAMDWASQTYFRKYTDEVADHTFI